MGNPQIGIEIIDKSLTDNHYWRKLVTMFALVGMRFEIHCWNEETEEIKAASIYGEVKTSDWEFGTIIEGMLDEKFIEMIYHTIKPQDTEIHNKMTPFFSIFFENGFSSEHYGTEFHILSAPTEDLNFTALLEEIREYAIINKY
ncbi:hypothetical protein acsn021_20080 [Anaerocolumna cellulosilytica]|uniref:Uncharacterized protein n=1 Tax=Anaerocolumna cellulosilytica TaxID=433286 RepID=A0A6S6QZE8_9FIRM|nr:hypothetical protein [Anaerocolumna cellulosilytica]MBB5196439.1 hypothetical protein [Anaerocolumna cellulosilytica]BCJ94439.1 hypothetical protein acsn021_20080 [Anaerocolumna cellulosilytica]